MKVFDAAVIGLGTMGTFACRDLARRGLSVVGFDQFAPPHDRGSHTGATRVFRVAYAEHPGYVPLAQRAGVLWDELGAEEGATFLHRTGMLSLGEPESSLIAGARSSAALHQLELHDLSRDDVRSRFPAFVMPQGWEAVFEPTAGWIDVDASLLAGLTQAERSGAELHRNTALEEWKSTGDRFVIRTSGGSFSARRMIVTAGAWASQVLADLNLPLTVVHKLLVWVQPKHPELFAPDRFPIFASSTNFFYGFPNLHNNGVKLAIHWSADDTAEMVMEAASDLVPSLAAGRVIRTKTCLYTMTPDEHFLIDRHPRLQNLIFAAGFSGHGFKFAPAVGEALADLALHGKSSLPIDFLSLERLPSPPH